jgi:phosphatidylinositol kinase/protein kinase (PI-3  family)
MPITPLSKRSGLIQYVSGTDTVLRLITEYRQRNLIRPREEDFRDANFIPEVDSLTVLQRLEYITRASEELPSTDLREAIWLSSQNISLWMMKRLRFIQTWSISAIVGYIVGLGDRHPDNIMVACDSGDVIHVDFAECFEIGQRRVKFPEAVPFRLTRMVRTAFGPEGIEGEFRTVCELTMKVIRSHRESIATVLDIFLQAPIEYGVDEDEKLASRPSEADLVAREKDLFNIPAALQRIALKTAGVEFQEPHGEPLSIEDHVDRLINEAVDLKNLARMYHGWTPLW